MQHGFAVIHANRLEDLTALTVDWVRAHPLSPLSDDVFLVESNGIAQWLRLALADDSACGISAAQQFQMPSRFLWQAYRAVLGEQAVPRTSPFDKSQLLWRLMRLLPTLSGDGDYLPLQRFLAGDDDLRKHYQLSERLADLYDQYQVYRADWLAHWEQGNDTLPSPDGRARPLAAQRWQAKLWRALRDDMLPEQRDTSRASIHTRFLAALDHGEICGTLPPRIIVFGISALPRQTLEALHALSAHCQVLLLVQNPSEHYWGDIVEDRELLRREHARHAGKASLTGLDPEALALAANPLLASWGKQGRDYINLLYSFDAPEKYQQWFQSIDLFQAPGSDTGTAATLLTQIQQDIFNLDNAASETPRPLTANDDSVAFHVAHSPQREVEVLHDQLLARLEADPTLRERDIIVMVPDIQRYAPHIDAVFGAVPSDDTRHIPYTISDRSQQHTRPLAAALAKLLNAPTLRFTVSDILDLLDVSAVRRRFGIAAQELPLLHQWIEAAGIRWGFDADHRATLALPGHLGHNSWLFGLERMLVGYAIGDGAPWQDIEPYAEVAGLSASLAGQLAAFVRALQSAWQALATPATPAQWRHVIMSLLDDIALTDEEEDARLVASVIDALEQWQQHCDDARFDETVPASVLRAVLLRALDAGSLSQRFLAGRVNFCTLMPMRSIPFRMVCLLGMNDGDYPRAQLPMDFDLMAARGEYRPGDRSRREDDRYLFLEALLSARDTLYISWVGRNIRDNAAMPPSVLVAQLRDYIQQGWRDGNADPLPALTVMHPLQPFSRDYFSALPDDARSTLFTYAHEWRDALVPRPSPSESPLPLPEDLTITATPMSLSRFLQDPVALFYNERLKVRALPTEAATLDDEPFALDALSGAAVRSQLLNAALRAVQGHEDPAVAITSASARLCATGQLPPPPWDNLLAETLNEDTLEVARLWQIALAQWPDTADSAELQLDGLLDDMPFAIEGWLSGLRQRQQTYCQLQAFTGDINDKPWRLLSTWVNHLCGNAQGLPLESWAISATGCTSFAAMAPDAARALLSDMAAAWRSALQAPLPLAPRSGFACFGKTTEDANLSAAEKRYEDNFQHPGEKNYASNALLRRSFPDFRALTTATLNDEPAFVAWARQLYAPLLKHRQTLDLGGPP